VNVRWHLGIPFNDTSNFRLAIADQGQKILGDYLIGLQAGNEPDLYADHGHRPSVSVVGFTRIFLILIAMIELLSLRLFRRVWSARASYGRRRAPH